MMDRSALFRSYNAARQLAAQGLIDRARLDRALGVAQRGTALKYGFLDDRCQCPDQRFNLRERGCCKHALARCLLAIN